MKKNIFLITLMVLVVFSLSACSSIVQEPIDAQKDIDTVQNADVEHNTTGNVTPGASETQSVEIENTQVNGGTQVCAVHHIDYHTYDSYLTDYVGYDSFREWFTQYSIPVEDASGGCLYPKSNIYEFIHHFDISKDVLIKLYNEFSITDYNIELLYDGTAEENDQYYRSISDAQRIEEIKMSNFKELKVAIRLNNIDAFPEIMNYDEYSLIEMMLITDTPLDFIYDRIERTKKKHGDSIYGSQYEYDFSVFNEKNRAKLEKDINEHSAFYLDCIFCGVTPYETKYEKQISENEKLNLD